MKNFKKIFILTLIISFAVSLMSCKPETGGISVNSLKQDIPGSGIKPSEEDSDNVLINDPKANQVSILKITGQAIDLKVTGDYLYLTNDLGYLYVVDIKDKKNPEVVGKCAGIDAANIVFIEDDYVFVSYSKYDVKSSELKVDYGFKIIDIKDKKNPKVIGNWQKQSIGTDRSVHGMYIKDNHAFLTVVSLKEKKSTSTFQVVDISKKSKPVSEGSFDIDGSANAIWAEDDYVFINLIVYESAAGDLTKDLKDLKSKSYVIAIDIKNKKNPKITGRCEVATESWGLIVDKDNAYISSNNYDYQAEKYHDSFLQIVSMNDKANPVLLGECKIKGGAWEVDFKNDYLFVSDLEGGFSIIDVKDKANPEIIDYLKTKGASYDVEVVGKFVYLADGFEGLKIYELESSQSYEITDDTETKNSKPVADIEVFGDEAEYENKSGVYIFNLNNPVYFSALGSYDVDGDDLGYHWDIKGSENDFIKYSTKTKDKLSVLFKKTGEYEVTLKVTDGNLEDFDKTEIKILSDAAPLKLIKKHEFTVEVMTKIINNGKHLLKNLECFAKAPQNFIPFQEIIDINTNSLNQEIFFDNDFNKILNLKYGELDPGESFTATLKCRVEMPELSFKKIQSGQYFYDENDPDLKLYTLEDLFIDSDSSVIKGTAKKVVGNENDPVEIAKRLYGFVTARLHYDYDRAKDKNYDFYYASEILDLGKGICADYAVLYTALLRASGIPARIAAGVPVEAILTEPDKTLEFGHAWVEIKLPGYGWVPFDVTSEDNFMPKTLYLNLVMERGSSFLHKSVTMDWHSYYFDGFNYTWDGEGKPDVEQEISYKVYGLNSKDLSIYN